MALSRNFLKAMGLEADQIDEIIKAHTDTVDALKAEVKEKDTLAKEKANLETENKELKKQLEEGNNDGEVWKAKYTAMKEDFDNFKEGIEKEKTVAGIKKAYIDLIKGVGINNDKRAEQIAKLADLNGLELDENGKLTTESEIVESIKAEWGDFITSPQATNNTTVSTPPTSNRKPGTMTREEIFKITDKAEKQKAIRENLELFVGR